MSNKEEIINEYNEAAAKLDELRKKEVITPKPDNNKTEVFFPQFSGEMGELVVECKRLADILAAVEASED